MRDIAYEGSTDRHDRRTQMSDMMAIRYGKGSWEYRWRRIEVEGGVYLTLGAFDREGIMRDVVLRAYRNGVSGQWRMRVKWEWMDALSEEVVRDMGALLCGELKESNDGKQD